MAHAQLTLLDTSHVHTTLARPRPDDTVTYECKLYTTLCRHCAVKYIRAVRIFKTKYTQDSLSVIPPNWIANTLKYEY